MSKAPRVLKTNLPERAIQIQIRDALRWHGVRSRHIPNAGKRSPIAGRRLKQEGMVAGTPDLLCWLPGNPPRVGWLEVKAAKGRTSDAQDNQLAILTADGFRCAVVRSVDEALDALRAWGWVR
jgi:hypothetical protein